MPKRERPGIKIPDAIRVRPEPQCPLSLPVTNP